MARSGGTPHCGAPPSSLQSPCAPAGRRFGVRPAQRSTRPVYGSPEEASARESRSIRSSSHAKRRGPARDVAERGEADGSIASELRDRILHAFAGRSSGFQPLQTFHSA